MKKNVFLFMMATLFILSSCSKAAKVNKKIDGEWNVESIGGQSLDPGETFVFKFEKDKAGKGSFTITTSYQGNSDTEIGNYILEDDQYIYLRWAADSYAFVLKIQEYSKTELKLLDEDDNSVWILKKK
jgi:hypothetical protein